MYSEDLFDDEKLEKKSTFEDNSGERGQDGLFRIDLDKVSPENKNRGYRAELRFLPNFTDNPELVKTYAGEKWTEDLKVAVGPSHYQKVSHFLNFQREELSHLKGFYDDPTNINPKTQKSYTTEKWGPLAKTYFELKKSNNAIAQEKAKLIKYNNKYFSYVLVMKDEQQPELEGKIMILSYGKQIKDIIESEWNGEKTGERCNVFSLNKGKNFVLLAKEKTFTNGEGKEVTAPDYTKSSFYETPTSISLPRKDGSGFVQVPTDENGKIKREHQEKIVNFLLSREYQLEDFAGQPWDENTQAKVSEAIDYLTGKASSLAKASSKQEEIDDFSFDEVSSDDEEMVTETSSSSDDDVDFDDLDF
jgi:hypothetical protein